MGEDGAHAWLFHDVVEARGYRHRSGEIVLLNSLMIWQRGRKKVKNLTIRKFRCFIPKIKLGLYERTLSLIVTYF